LQRAGGKQFDPGSQLQSLRLSSSQERNQQWRDRYPAKHVEIGKREYQDLQDSGEQNQKPGTFVNLHVSRIAKGGLQALGFRSALTLLLT
jgi:hypothetical protein